MAKKYYQGKKDRMHESKGMEGHHEDHPSKHMGHGEFANMPRQEMMHPYPKESYGYNGYNDTITGIDEENTESANKIKRNPSHQK